MPKLESIHCSNAELKQANTLSVHHSIPNQNTITVSTMLIRKPLLLPKTCIHTNTCTYTHTHIYTHRLSTERAHKTHTLTIGDIQSSQSSTVLVLDSVELEC